MDLEILFAPLIAVIDGFFGALQFIFDRFSETWTSIFS